MKKMKKPFLWGSIAIVVIILLSVLLILNLNNDSGDSSSGIINSLKAPTEKENYAKYAAEVSCEFLGIDFEDKDVLIKTVDKVQIIMQEHGYTYSQTMELNEKYQNDTEFQEIAYKEAKKICSDKLEELGITEFVPGESP